MTTKAEMVAIIKAENPTLQLGDDEQGYKELSAKAYETQIAVWADARLAKEAQILEAKSVAQAKLDAVAKLTALGLDPRAFGL